MNDTQFIKNQREKLNNRFIFLCKSSNINLELLLVHFVNDFGQHNFPQQINKSLSHTTIYLFIFSSVNDWPHSGFVTRTIQKKRAKFILKKIKHKTKNLHNLSLCQELLLYNAYERKRKRQSVSL